MNNTPNYARRQKIALLLVLLVVGFGVYFGSEMTTPDECKVPASQMSRFCLDLLYP